MRLEVRGDVADYYFEIQRFDREVGQLMAHYGHSANSITRFSSSTSDHGMPFPARQDESLRLRCTCAAGDSLASSCSRRPNCNRSGFADRSCADVSRGCRPGDSPANDRAQLARLLESGKSGSSRGDARSCVFRSRTAYAGSRSTERRRISDARDPHGEFLYIRNFEPDRWPSGTPDYTKAFFQAVLVVGLRQWADQEIHVGSPRRAGGARTVCTKLWEPPGRRVIRPAEGSE